MQTINTTALHEAIAAVCPIEGVSIGDPEDKSTWRIDYAPEATEEEKAAAQAVIDTWVDPPPSGTAGEELAFDHENRILALEGKPPITMDEFKAK